MNADVFRIKQALEKDENFKAIKNVEEFAERLSTVYWRDNLRLVEEIRKAGLWVFANPARKKKNYSRFLVNWMSKVFQKR